MDETNSDHLAPRAGAFSAPVRVRVRYWAGARAAAGVEASEVTAGTVGELRKVAISQHPGLVEVLPRCSILVDGQRCDDDAMLTEAANVEVLPPFAGG